MNVIVQSVLVTNVIITFDHAGAAAVSQQMSMMRSPPPRGGARVSSAVFSVSPPPSPSPSAS